MTQGFVYTVTTGSVDSVVGTTNEVDVNSADASNPIVGLSSTIVVPGTFDIQSSTAVDSILDDDTLSADSATALATQQSIKAYVDSQVSALGLVLQVVQTVDTTNRSTSSTSFVDSGISVTITPSSVSSRISLSVNGIAGTSALTSASARFTLYRDSTPLTPSGTAQMSVVTLPSNLYADNFIINFIDSPSTISAVTYKLYFLASSDTAYIGRRGQNTSYDVATVFTASDLRS